MILARLQENAAAAAEGEKLNPGKVIMEHIANSPSDHPLIHLPPVFGIDFSISKHVFMLLLVAATVFTVITFVVRRYIKSGNPLPTGAANGLEAVVEFIRDSIVMPNVGKKYVNTWAPLILTFFVFIFSANLIGLIPFFEPLAVINHFIHTDHESLLVRVTHGGTTATANYNVTAALAVVTFFAIIVAGTKAHGFVKHWKNLVPHGLPWPIYIILIPIELMGMFVKPFALTMRLAANMTGGHIALLAIMMLVFIFTELFNTALAGIAAGLLVSVPLAVGISALELIVVLVQAYVFTLLSAVFIGMAIHVHH
jgi:F-type H+-transporting ATPase subunit a